MDFTSGSELKPEFMLLLLFLKGFGRRRSSARARSLFREDETTPEGGSLLGFWLVERSSAVPLRFLCYMLYYCALFIG